MNIYVMIVESCEIGGIGGYASNPNIGSLVGLEDDKVAVDYNEFGHTYQAVNGIFLVLEHEVGHFLDLFHTRNSLCGENDCTTEGDLCCDTDAWGSGDIQGPCGQVSFMGFCSDLADEFDNFMERANFSVGCFPNYHFTSCQVNRMHFTLSQIPRTILVDPANLIQTGVSDLYSGLLETLSINANVEGASCYECCNGSVSFDAVGGLPPYEFYWDGNLLTSQLVEDLCAGIYTLEVTDALGCSGIIQIEIVQPEVLAIQSIVGAESVSCYCEGEVHFLVSGGLPIYNFYIDGVFDSQGSEGLMTIGGLCPGEYELSVVDQGGNEVSQSFSVPGAGAVYEEPLVLNSLDSNPLIPGNTYIFQQGIEIQSGSFIFDNIHMRMGPNTNIVIHEDAFLTLTNNSLVDACNNSWDGIVVLSNSNTPNLPGHLKISANCTIKYASTAIYTEDESATINEPTDTWEGGIIECSQSNFEDCRRFARIRNSIYVDEDELPALSFNACHFSITSNYIQHFSTFQSAFEYSLIKGYSFLDCTLSNTLDQVEYWSQRGIGINSNNALYEFSGTDALNLATINGFQFGIKAAVTIGEFNGMKIKYTHFNHNKIAINTNGVCFHEILRNEIEVANPVLDVPALQGDWTDITDYEGICIIGGGAYKIEENNITGFILPTAAEDVHTIGVRITGTNQPGDQVYNNTARDLTHGFLANGDNADPNNGSGLRFVCNKNYDDSGTASEGNRKDFAVGSFDSQPIESIAIGSVQFGVPEDFGQDDLPAGNTFTDTDYPDLHDEGHYFYHGGYGVDYWFYDNSNSLEQEPDLDYITPTVVDVTPLSSENTCPSQIVEIVGDNGEFQLSTWDKWQDIASSAHDDWVVSVYIKQQLLDEGNTEVLKDEISGLYIEEVWDMRQRLLDASPYLSMTVLREVADRTDLYPHAIALEIFLANPDVLRNQVFINYLSSKADPMPEYMIDLLLAARNTTTTRSILEEQITLHRTRHAHASEKLLRAETFRSFANPDNRIPILSEMHCITCEFGIVQHLLDRGEASQAAIVLDEIPFKLELDESDIRELTAFETLFDIQVSLIATNRQWNQLTNSELVELYDLADLYFTYAGMFSINILNEHYNAGYFIPPATDESSWTPRHVSMVKGQQMNEVSVYPNPANYVLTIELDLLKPLGLQGLLSIYDSNGKVVENRTVQFANEQLIFDTRSWTNGQYVYEIVTSGSEKLSGTFEIIH